jgi:hypothetical protein
MRDAEPLDPYLLAQIFTQPIIQGNEAPSEKAPEKPLNLRFLGENQKNILILIKNPTAAYLSDDSFNLLSNILNACKLGILDIALVNVSNYENVSFETFQQQSQAKYGILFGVDPATIQLEPLPLYKTILVNGINCLAAEDLAHIGADKTKKGALWIGLKQLFNI